MSSILGDLTDFFNNASSVITSTPSSIAAGISDVTADLFGDTSKTTDSNIKTPVSDSVSSNFTTKTPKSGVFVTNPLKPGMQDSTKGKISTTSSTSLNTVASRYLLSATTGITSIYDSVTSNIKATGIAGLFQSATGVISSTASVASQGLSVYQQSTNFYTQAQNEFSSMSSQLGNLLGGNSSSLSAMFNSSLPLSTLSIGSALSTSNVSATTIQAILTGLSNSGCNTNGKVSSTAASQSLFNGLLGIVSKLGLNSLLSSILSCPKYDKSTEQTAKTTFQEIAPINPLTASILSQKMGAANSYLADVSLKEAIANTKPTAEDTAGLEIILNASLYQDKSSVLKTTSSTGTSASPYAMWDYETLSKTDSTVIDKISGTTDLSIITSALSDNNYSAIA